MKPSKEDLLNAYLNIQIFIFCGFFLFCFGCTNRTVVPYSLETPPLILVPAKAVVEDGRGRFREIYCTVRKDHGKLLPEDKPCDEVIMRLGDEPLPTGRPVNLSGHSHNIKVLIVPGIFSQCGDAYVSTFSDAISHLEKLDYKTSLIRVSGRDSCTHNAKEIRDYILEKVDDSEKVVLIGYSKGAPDILEAVVSYPEIQGRIAAVVSIAGAIGGSQMIDAIPKTLRKLEEEMHMASCPSQDKGGLESLRPANRMKWLAEHTLPRNIRFFSLVAFSDRNGISSGLRSLYDLLSQIDPRNDSQVIFYNAIIPGSTLLGYVKADHWAMGMPFSRKSPILAATFLDHNAFPREVLLEAVVRYVEEDLYKTQAVEPTSKRKNEGSLRYP
jgi:hypothetical protein